MDMLDALWIRISALAIAAVVLFAAWKLHGSSGKMSRATKVAGVLGALVAGLAFLVTFVGDLAGQISAAYPGLMAVGLVACAAVILVDWLIDGRPDRPAFIAMFLLPIFLALGLNNLDMIGDQIGDGADRVGTELRTGE